MPTELPSDIRVEEPMQGLRCWRNKLNGFFVMEVHYTADPNKRGRDWKERTSKPYGGVASPRWRREFEIDWGAGLGELVWPNFDRELHGIPTRRYPSNWLRVCLIDPGWTNPTAVHLLSVNTDARHSADGSLPLFVEREWSESRRSPEEAARAIVKMVEGVDVEVIICDPAAKQEHQGNANKVTGKAEPVFDRIEDELIRMGCTVPMIGGNNSKTEPLVQILERLGGYWMTGDGFQILDERERWREPTDDELLGGAYRVAPTLQIDQSCRTLLWEMARYHWKELPTGQGPKRNNPESPVDKDDHGITNLVRAMNWLAEQRGAPNAITQDRGRELEVLRRRERMQQDLAPVTPEDHHRGITRRHRAARRGKYGLDWLEE